MAKNYTFAEAVRIINAGTDMESITDIGRRYPILLNKVTKVAAKAGEDFVELMNFMPDHLTANKVNAAIKNAGLETSTEEAEEDVEEAEEKTTKETKATKATKATKEAKDSDETDYESMSGKELWELLGKYGKRKDCKDKMGGAKKDDMIAYINKYGLENAEVEDEAETNAETEEATEANPYEGKSAIELFKECQKRGIKAAPKKPAKYYVELLVKADEEAEETVEESESDGWDDEEEVKAANDKPVKKAEKKAPVKKAAKKEEADEDDDWDI